MSAAAMLATGVTFAVLTVVIAFNSWVVVQIACQQSPDPIDGPTTKPTTPLVHLINQLRASHSTLMVALLSRLSLPKQVLTERYSGKSLSPLK